MRKVSISELKKLFQNNELSDTDITRLRQDERKGIQQLIAIYDRQKEKEMTFEKNFYEMCTYERNCYQRGMRYVAGIDEAGRGPLAGPVVAAAVVLPEDFKLLGLNDSKQLTEQQREEFFTYILENSVGYGIAVIDSEIIDKINILEATKLGMKEALEKIECPVEHVLIDAVKLDNLPCSSDAIIKGDAKSISIAAASILAKVTRDRLMKKIHQEFPIYAFHSNMGYGTKHHMEILREHGASPYHRKSFAPVRESLNA